LIDTAGDWWFKCSHVLSKSEHLIMHVYASIGYIPEMLNEARIEYSNKLIIHMCSKAYCNKHIL